MRMIRVRRRYSQVSSLHHISKTCRLASIGRRDEVKENGVGVQGTPSFFFLKSTNFVAFLASVAPANWCLPDLEFATSSLPSPPTTLQTGASLTHQSPSNWQHRASPALSNYLPPCVLQIQAHKCSNLQTGAFLTTHQPQFCETKICVLEFAKLSLPPTSNPPTMLRFCYRCFSRPNHTPVVGFANISTQVLKLAKLNLPTLTRPPAL